MSDLISIIFILFFFVAGIVLVVGARRKSNWLVNPPDELWACYSQAFIKKLFGQRFLIGFTYFLGVLFVLFSVLGLFSRIWDGPK
jgi:hypothetical protein